MRLNSIHEAGSSNLYLVNSLATLLLQTTVPKLCAVTYLSTSLFRREKEKTHEDVPVNKGSKNQKFSNHVMRGSRDSCCIKEKKTASYAVSTSAVVALRLEP